jgi:hypothetical protein
MTRSSAFFALMTLPLFACAGAPRPPEGAEAPASPTAPSDGPATAEQGAASADQPQAVVDASEPPAKPAEPPPITSVSLELYNNCPTAMDYCVDDGNTLYTSITTSTTTTHSVRPGAKIRYRKSNNCTDTVYTVTAESEKQKTNLCK